VIGVLMSVVSVYYYLLIPVLMYMREPAEEAQRASLATGEGVVLAVCAAAVLFFGLFPNAETFPLVDWARDSVRLLFPPG
jgi:NADH-quinone oxidoreductase subunit N